jgi:DNA adenine methylase Dam
MKIKSKQLKTALRYPGGKSRAISKISQFFPDLSNYKEYREPFLGGGSVAIYVTQQYPNLNIWVNDLYEPLINFWKQLRDRGDEIEKYLKDLKQRYNNPDRAKVLFLESKEYLSAVPKRTDDLHRAIAYYIVNKCSFSGLTESSSFSPQASENNFSMRGIEKLSEYSKIIKKWTITNYSYNGVINFWSSDSAFVYLDPPYDIKDNLYGNKGSMHKGFDHDQFAIDCDNSSLDMLISYNSSQLVKDRFSKWSAVEFDHTYTMRSTGEYLKNQKDRKELLLLNYSDGKALST